ncbi:MAG: DUF423 domain-containing protein [Saprospiraceae bacterium]|nr:DUF423 domain-containing protein [Saprospiraceae bacterium]
MKSIIIAAAGLGALAVILGAFGAHSLADKLSAESLASYKTGVLYHFLHVLVILIVGIYYQQKPNNLMRWAVICFIVGIVFFSGSIYLLATRSITGLSFTNILGPITPIGGLLFVSGWILLAFGLSKMDLRR